MMRDEKNFLPLYACLGDRFGDHGLISVVVLKVKPAELEILDWLMSCRVLTRGVEQFLMNRVVAVANEMGLRRVSGQYIPTAKNGMVKEFYAQFGFENVLESDGCAQWQLDPKTYRMRPVYITEND
jgi:FkbH-like protein